MPYVICKSTRIPGPVSYDGPTWDRAGIRDLRRDTYDDREEARVIADLLALANPVGFDVEEV